MPFVRRSNSGCPARRMPRTIAARPQRAHVKIFVTGANGFIGGSVAAALVANGDTVRGLVRTQEKADQVAAVGVTPVIGSLDDVPLLQAEARAADAVVNAA